MVPLIDAGTMYVDDLPGVWNPVQWEMSEEERAQELEQQAEASLLWNVNVPEAILRFLLNETAIQAADEPPAGFDPALQGEWQPNLLTFTFKRAVHLEHVVRTADSLQVTYTLEGSGTWTMQIEPERFVLERT